MRYLVPRSSIYPFRATWAAGPTHLALVLALGLLLRLGWLWLMQPHPLWLDESEYLAIARTIRGGSYLDDFLWVRVPLFPLWLALTLGPMENLGLARLAQIALSEVLIYQVYRIALVVWQDGRVATLAALGAAVSLPLIAYARSLMAETLLLVLLAAMLLVLLRLMRLGLQQPHAWRGVALAGVLLGLAALTKPIAIACGPVLLVAIWLAGMGRKPENRLPEPSPSVGAGLQPAPTPPPLGRPLDIPPAPTPLPLGRPAVPSHHSRTRSDYLRILLYSGLGLLCAALVITPWTLRNMLVHGRLIVLDTTGGFNLWYGNRALEPEAAVFEAQVYATYPNLAERERAFAARAWQHARHQPGLALQGVGEKLVRFWRLNADIIAAREFGDLPFRCITPRPGRTHGILTPADVSAEEQARFCLLSNLNLIEDGVYLICLLGLMMGLLRQQPAHFAWLGWPWLMAIWVLTALTVVQPRLRLPLLPILFPWSAAGLVDLWALAHHRAAPANWWRLDWWQATLRHWQLVVGIATVLVGGWLLNIPAIVGSQAWQMQGWAAWYAGNAPGALQAFEQAATWYPQRISSLLAAGQVAEVLGANDRALAWYRAATTRVSYEPQARIGAARILLARSDQAGAKGELDSTLISGTRMEAWGFAAQIVPSRSFIDVGHSIMGSNYGYLIGFYLTNPEASAPSFRPTGEEAALRFGTLPTPTALLRLRVSGGRPPGAPPAWMHLLVSEQVHFHTAVDARWRIYHMLVPPTTQGITVTIRANTFTPAMLDPASLDTRSYGVALDWAELVTDGLRLNQRQQMTSVLTTLVCRVAATLPQVANPAGGSGVGEQQPHQMTSLNPQASVSFAIRWEPFAVRRYEG